MRIDNLKPGTKLMWDPKMDNPQTNKPIIYPAIVGEGNKKAKLVKIHTSNTMYPQWMGPESEYLRFPTQEEIEHLIWPEL